jgi:hypothetical protein
LAGVKKKMKGQDAGVIAAHDGRMFGARFPAQVLEEAFPG